MMIKNINTLFLLAFLGLGLSACGQRTAPSQDFKPYLGDTRHLQIPQWESEEWYVEDWTAQKPAMNIINGFYKADILRDQIKDADNVPVLVVGPNFYHLSGLDKRRVITLVDKAYTLTGPDKQGGFFLQDWYTHKIIGAFDQEGLRLD